MTDLYAVLGNPISHSKSPQIHAAFAKQTNQDMRYEAVLVPMDGFAVKVRELIKEGYKGLNITVPFKFEAFKIADILSERAKMAGAVNTLLFKAERIHGDNTDGIGLVKDITCNLNVHLANKRLLIMGAGGAAYGVMLPLIEAGAEICIANRTPQKAIEMAKYFFEYDSKIIASSYDDLKGRQFDVVINATSVGLTDDLPPISGEQLADGALAYDMMYGRETAFKALADAEAIRGVHFSDGLGMLVEQAAEAFYLWRGVRPDTAPVLASLRAAN